MHAICGFAICVDCCNVFHFDPKTGTLKHLFFFAEPEVNNQWFGETAIPNVFRIDAQEIVDTLPRFRPCPSVVKPVNTLVKLERFGDVFGWQDRNKSFHSVLNVTRMSGFGQLLVQVRSNDMSEPIESASLLEQIREIAETGLRDSSNIYDFGRYTQLLEIANEYAGHDLELPPKETRFALARALGAVTPRLGGDAAIFDDQGRVLLMLRTDNQCWCMPGGLAEVGETSEQSVMREAREETGFEVEILELVGVYSAFPATNNNTQTLTIPLYLCGVTGGALRSSHEDLGLQFWKLEDVPTWSGPHEQMARAAYERWLNFRDANR
jgi:8-oxo-dGTP pyrophosphatase MutT (NUDIX family)